MHGPPLGQGYSPSKFPSQAPKYFLQSVFGLGAFSRSSSTTGTLHQLVIFSVSRPQPACRHRYVPRCSLTASAIYRYQGCQVQMPCLGLIFIRCADTLIRAPGSTHGGTVVRHFLATLIERCPLATKERGFMAVLRFLLDLVIFLRLLNLARYIIAVVTATTRWNIAPTAAWLASIELQAKTCSQFNTFIQIQIQIALPASVSSVVPSCRHGSPLV